MPEVMANPDTALNSFFASSPVPSGEGDSGQASAPEPETKGGEGAETTDAGTVGKETPSTTTADDAAQASAAKKEQAGLGEEFKPFKSVLDAKKWDPSSKEFAPAVLKAYSELEKAHGQAATDKTLLNTRQTEFQRRLSGDAKSINEYRKANGYPEIPVGKTYAEQAQERAEYFTHINNVLTNQSGAPESRAWLEKQLVDELQDLRIKAGIESERANKTPEQSQQEFRGKASSVFTEHIAKSPADQAIFDQYVLPLAGPNGLLGSYGLDVAHVAQSPEHIQAWAKIGRALQLADGYEKAVSDAASKGIDEAMAQKRKAGNAGGVGSQGKQSAGASGDDFSASLWKTRHN